MYIAINCPKCAQSDVIYTLSPVDHARGLSVYRCHGCNHAVEDDLFWKLYREESERRNAEQEVYRSSFEYDLNCLLNSIDLAIGLYLRGRDDDSRTCIKSALEHHEVLLEKHGVCFCEHDRIKKKVDSWKKAFIDSREIDLDEQPFQACYQTVDEIFSRLAQDLKDACR